MCDEKRFPVLYDLDDSGEATGVVHFFCSTGCRSQSPFNDPSRRNDGMDGPAEALDGTVCETCRKPVVPVKPVTTTKAKRIIEAKLKALDMHDYKLTARTISFMDLARDSRIFVKVHGWTPHPSWDQVEAEARANGFRVE